MDNEFESITICGSMRFHEFMMEEAQDQSLRGFIVLMPFVVFKGDEQRSDDKTMLDEMHFEKIRQSVGIVVVTDTDGYVGESTIREIGFALKLGRWVSVSQYSTRDGGKIECRDFLGMRLR